MPINKSESTYILDVDFKGLKGEKKREAQTLIGELLIEKINSKLDSATTPVKDAPYKRKKKDGSLSRLFEFGDMRSQITFVEHSRGVKIGIFSDADEKDKLKAYNHGVGDTLPARRFIPKPDEEFKGDILRSVDAIVNRIKRESPEEEKRLTVGDLIGDEN